MYPNANRAWMQMQKRIDLGNEISRILSLEYSAQERICLKDTTGKFCERVEDLVAYIMDSFESSEQQLDDITTEMWYLTFLKAAIDFVNTFASVRLQISAVLPIIPPCFNVKHVNKFIEVAEFTYYFAQNILWAAHKVCKLFFLLFIVFVLINLILIFCMFYFPR